jgi:bifunctional UDP-N-acetylglucosamine pyrophosphorylase/glucosamine-1-phosphate N-acetyltransferase
MAETAAGTPPRVAVILAAGEGTRMRSALPKVLHRAAGRPLLGWALEAARGAGCARVLVVVGHGAGAVREALAGEPVTWVTQEQRLGTGHALAQAEPHLADLLAAFTEGGGGGRATLLVLPGDAPLVTAATLDQLARRVEGGEPAGGEQTGAWGALAVAETADPGTLGRVIVTGERLERIVEVADAGPDELAVTTVNAGLYALPAPEVFDRLRRLEPANAQGELYLTDVPVAAAAEGLRVDVVRLADPDEALGVNTRRELAAAHRRLIDRRLGELMDAGVTVLEPARTVVEPSVEVGADTVVHPGASLLGATRVGGGCVLEQGAWLRDSELGDGVVVGAYSGRSARTIAAAPCWGCSRRWCRCHLGPGHPRRSSTRRCRRP